MHTLSAPLYAAVENFFIVTKGGKAAQFYCKSKGRLAAQRMAALSPKSNRAFNLKGEAPPNERGFRLLKKQQPIST
jgi:hypothetical protein